MSQGFEVGDYILDSDNCISNEDMGCIYGGWRKGDKNFQVVFQVCRFNRISLGKKLLIQYKQEAALKFKNIDHKNIVRVLDIEEKSDRLFIVKEYVKGGDLAKYIRNNGAMSDENAKILIRQITDGLIELQKNRVLHRDIKPEHILLSETEDLSKCIYKLCGYALSKELPEDISVATTAIGSPRYCAPEVMLKPDEGYDIKVDLWSVGCVLFEVLTGKKVFTDEDQYFMDPEDVISKIMYPETMNPDAIDLIKKVLVYEPKENPPWKNRISFEEFVDHPYLIKKEK